MMLHTYQSGYEPVGSDITAEPTLLDGETAGYTFDYTDQPSTAKEIPSEANGGIVRVEGYDTSDGQTFGMKIWGYGQRSPAELICDISGVFGTARINDSTVNLHADTMSVNTDGHYKSVTAYDSGNNRICKLGFDIGGYRNLYFEFYDVSDADSGINAFIRWY